jgi:tetratricopeptide (TPR) repeat protein
MGKNKKRGNGKNNSNKSSKGREHPQARRRQERERPSKSAEELIQSAEEHFSRGDFEGGLSALQKAVTQSPHDAEILAQVADLQMQVGLAEEAEQTVGRVLQSGGPVPPAVWMMQGQLLSGSDSLEAYERGVDIILDSYPQLNARALLGSSQPNAVATALSPGTIQAALGRSEEEAVAADLLSSAYASIAELYLTDLQEGDETDRLCEDHLAQALALSPFHVDSLLALTSLKIDQADIPSTLRLLKRRIVPLVVPSFTFQQEQKDEEDEEEDDSLFHTNSPAVQTHEIPYHTRMQAAKLLLESSTEDSLLAEPAAIIVSGLLEEDEENIELWYLMGVVNLSTNPPDREGAVEALERAQEMLEANREFCQENNIPFENQSEMDLVMEHLALAQQTS